MLLIASPIVFFCERGPLSIKLYLNFMETQLFNFFLALKHDCTPSTCRIRRCCLCCSCVRSVDQLVRFVAQQEATSRGEDGHAQEVRCGNMEVGRIREKTHCAQ